VGSRMLNHERPSRLPRRLLKGLSGGKFTSKDNPRWGQIQVYL
jgi:hypothetical protein